MIAARFERPCGHCQDERRQAAVWGLGKVGAKAYRDLVQFVADDDENVAFHAIAAFGSDTPKAMVRQLVQLLLAGGEREAAAASEALQVIGGEVVLAELISATQSGGGAPNWVLATLGRLSPALVRERLRGQAILERLEPMLLMARGANWLADEEAVTDMAFLLKQNL